MCSEHIRHGLTVETLLLVLNIAYFGFFSANQCFPNRVQEMNDLMLGRYCGSHIISKYYHYCRSNCLLKKRYSVKHCALPSHEKYMNSIQIKFE